MLLIFFFFLKKANGIKACKVTRSMQRVSVSLMLLLTSVSHSIRKSPCFWISANSENKTSAYIYIVIVVFKPFFNNGFIHIDLDCLTCSF